MADIGVVVFPGSNCDRDAQHVFSSVMGRSAAFHWHDQSIRNQYKAVILPGGFAHGDYLRCGAMAKLSPAVQSLGEFIDRGGLVLGICNGFQVLVEAGYLPGALTKNRSLRFQCEDVFVRVESNQSPYTSAIKVGTVLRLPIAHSEGCYVTDEATLSHLEKNGQVILRYTSPTGELKDEFNANGSMNAIAALANEKGNVFGLMPHPERCSEAVLGNDDGLAIFRSMVEHL